MTSEYILRLFLTNVTLVIKQLFCIISGTFSNAYFLFLSMSTFFVSTGLTSNTGYLN